MSETGRQQSRRRGLVIMLLLAFAVGTSAFQLRQGETAVVTTLGRPSRPLRQAGLYPKWPWPVQRVHRFDGRLRSYQSPLEQTYTRDGQYLLVELYAAWRIAEPTVYLERVGDEERLASRLRNLLATASSAVFAQVDFADLISTAGEGATFDTTERRLAAAVADELAGYGVDLAAVGIRRLQLPEEVTAAVFERMRKERAVEAARVRAAGQEEAAVIRASAEEEAATITHQATAEATRIVGEAERQAAASYQIFRRNPGLAIFEQELRALPELVGDGETTLLLPADGPVLRLLKEPGGGG